MSNKPRGPLVAALMVIIGVALLAACSGSTAHGRPRAGLGTVSPVSTRPPAAPAPVDSAAALLRASWASDGERGFFVEAPDVGQAMSLYATRWWLELFRHEHGALPPSVNASAVRSWVAPLATGRLTVAGDATDIPELARLDDAVAVLEMLGSHPDPAPVVRALESLRVGGRFRSGPKQPADWGDTSLAVSLYERLGIQPPLQVRAAMTAELRRALVDRTPADLLGVVVPALATARPSRADLGRLRAELRWIRAQLLGLPAVARVSVAVTLGPLVRRAHLPPWPAQEVCQGLPPSAAGAAAGLEADAQLSADAVVLRCGTKPGVPPWTSSGWPNRSALDGALPASVDGIRLAGAVHLASTYAAPLRRSLVDDWAPTLRGTSSPNKAVAADLLCRELDVPLIAPASRGAVDAALSDGLGAATMEQLLLAVITHPRGVQQASTPGGVSGSRPSMVLAISAKLRAQLTGRRTDLAAARRVVARMRSGSIGLYALEPGAPPSLFATVFGHWVTGEPLTPDLLRAGGLCTAGYFTCHSDASAGASVPALQTAAAVLGLGDRWLSYPYPY